MRLFSSIASLLTVKLRQGEMPSLKVLGDETLKVATTEMSEISSSIVQDAKNSLIREAVYHSMSYVCDDDTVKYAITCIITGITDTDIADTSAIKDLLSGNDEVEQNRPTTTLSRHSSVDTIHTFPSFPIRFTVEDDITQVTPLLVNIVPSSPMEEPNISQEESARLKTIRIIFYIARTLLPILGHNLNIHVNLCPNLMGCVADLVHSDKD